MDLFECNTGSKGSLWGHCNAISCSNGRHQLDQWAAEECQVHKGYKHNTGKCTCPPPFFLWTFPTAKNDAVARTMWIKLVNRKGWTPNAKSRLCSKHFAEGRPTVSAPYPTQNMGYSVINKPTSRKPPTVRAPLEPAREMEQPFPDISVPSSSGAGPADLNDEESANVEDPQEEQIVNEHSYFTSRNKCSNCTDLEKEIKKLENRLHNVRVCGPKLPVAHQFVNTDKKVNANTGLKDQATLQGLHNLLYQKAKKLRYWIGHKAHMKKGIRQFKGSPKKPGPEKKLLSIDELIMVLMKLRLGLTNSLLCDIFSVSQGLCSKILNTWIPLLAKELKALVFWPDKDVVLQHMPQELAKKYPQLRCTIDCTEIFINRPRNLALQQATWSDYKKHNTVKYLIAIAPNGTISFLSQGYGGRTSDRAVVHDSGFLDLVDPGDVILADRGFTIAGDLLQRHARLEIPPPSSGWDQQTNSAVAKTKKVANARIHVERAIGRIKVFAILKNTLPLNLVPILDDIMFVCAALCNLRKPLVGK